MLIVTVFLYFITQFHFVQFLDYAFIYNLQLAVLLQTSIVWWKNISNTDSLQNYISKMQLIVKYIQYQFLNSRKLVLLNHIPLEKSFQFPSQWNGLQIAK